MVRRLEVTAGILLFFKGVTEVPLPSEVKEKKCQTGVGREAPGS